MIPVLAKVSRCRFNIRLCRLTPSRNSAVQVPSIETLQLTKRFGARLAVDSLNLQVEPGEIFGLLGPNGAGKTTTIRMLTTLLQPSSGDARVAGFDLRHEAFEVRRHIGYVPQMLSADPELTGYENLLLFSKLYRVPASKRKPRIAEALDFMQITDSANKLVRHYSGGMIRRLEIAQSLINRPDILFLDEPTVGLDPTGRHSVLVDALRDLMCVGAGSSYGLFSDFAILNRACGTDNHSRANLSGHTSLKATALDPMVSRQTGWRRAPPGEMQNYSL
jgi:ABC-type Na+ transport system ATPase subunit NatA